MKKTKILIDCHVFDAGMQGTTTYLAGLYTEMIKFSDFEFYFAANNLDNIKSIFGICKQVHYIKYARSNKFYRLLIGIPQIIKKYNINYTHFQYITPWTKTGKFIVTIHDVLFLDYPQYFPLFYKLTKGYLFKKAAKKADVLLTVSEYSKEQITKYFKVDQVAITPNAVADEFYTSYDKIKLKQEIKTKYGFVDYMIYVSRFEPRKNHHILLKAFVEKGYYKNYQLVFVGHQSIINQLYKRYYDNLDNEVKDKIVHLENIPYRDLVKLVKAADLSIYPSIAEGFGIPPLESAAAGVPTVCADNTAMSDFTFLKEYSFKATDIQSLHQAMQKALKQYQSKDIQQLIKQEYSWQKSALVLKKLIRSEP